MSLEITDQDAKVLLKIKRQFTESEAIKVLQQQLSAEKYRVGELSSEVAELTDKLQIAVGDLAEAVGKEIELRKCIKTVRLNNKRMEKDLEMWRNKALDLQNRLVAAQASVATESEQRT